MSDATMIQNQGGMGVSADEWLPPTTTPRFGSLCSLLCTALLCSVCRQKLNYGEFEELCLPAGS